MAWWGDELDGGDRTWNRLGGIDGDKRRGGGAFRTLPVRLRNAWHRHRFARQPGGRGGAGAARVRLPAGPGRAGQLLALRASINFGNTLCTSPTIPRSATEKMGASWSLLMATMFFEFFMPTMCWVAPEIPHAM